MDKSNIWLIFGVFEMEFTEGGCFFLVRKVKDKLGAFRKTGRNGTLGKHVLSLFSIIVTN